MTRVLIVDSDAEHRESLSRVLENEGYETSTAANGVDALRSFAGEGADVVLMDWALPGVNGLDVCRELRRTSRVPVVMVSDRDHETEKVLALELGADDYVTKPFSSRELVARVRAIMRGYADSYRFAAETLEVGPVRLDVEQHRVTLEGREVHFALMEFNLLQMLLRNAGRVLTRQQILDRIWGADRGGARTLGCHIRRLRLKIEPVPTEPCHILTVRGVGYKYSL